MRAFFVRSALSLALNKLSYEKRARKMLMKLTDGGNDFYVILLRIF